MRPEPTLTSAPTPGPTIAPIGSAFAGEDVVIVTTDDSISDPHRVSIFKTLRANVHFDAEFACERETEITIDFVDALAEPPPSDRHLATIVVDCSPRPARFTGIGPRREAPLGIEVVISGQGGYWVVVAASATDVVG